MSNWNTFLKSVLAGVMIGLGVTAFISSENKVFGSRLWDFFRAFTLIFKAKKVLKVNLNCLMILYVTFGYS